MIFFTNLYSPVSHISLKGISNRQITLFVFRRINAPTDSQFDTDSPIEVRILVREFTALDLNAPEEVSSEGVPNVDLQN